MHDAPTRQQVLDEEHLRLLSLFYYVSAATTALVAVIGAFYVLMGLFMLLASSASRGARGEAAPEVIGVVFILVGVAIIMLFALLAALKVWAGRCIRVRRRRTACLVVGGLSCLGIPYGTILGVFTFLVLQRPSVVALFAPPTRNDPAPPPEPAPPAAS